MLDLRDETLFCELPGKEEGDMVGFVCISLRNPVQGDCAEANRIHLAY